MEPKICRERIWELYSGTDYTFAAFFFSLLFSFYLTTDIVYVLFIRRNLKRFAQYPCLKSFVYKKYFLQNEQGTYVYSLSMYQISNPCRHQTESYLHVSCSFQVVPLESANNDLKDETLNIFRGSVIISKM
jgi:hypothetical protein